MFGFRETSRYKTRRSESSVPRGAVPEIAGYSWRRPLGLASAYRARTTLGRTLVLHSVQRISSHQRRSIRSLLVERAAIVSPPTWDVGAA